MLIVCIYIVIHVCGLHVRVCVCVHRAELCMKKQKKLAKTIKRARQMGRNERVA